MAVWFDDRLRPLDLMIFPAEYSSEDLDAAFITMETSYRKLAAAKPRARVALLCDLTAIRTTRAENRRRAAAAFANLSTVLARCAVGQVFVVSGPIPRAALTATLWIQRPPWPVRVCATQIGGLDWLREKFAREGVRMPEPEPWWEPLRRIG